MKIVEDSVASNVSANLGGPNANNQTNVSGIDAPLKKKVIKHVTASLLARRKYKPELLSEAEKDSLVGVDRISCPERGIWLDL